MDDVVIRDVWDGWCGLVVTLEDGSARKVHSMYFAEMNKGAAVDGPKSARAQSGTEEYPLTFTVIDLETTSANWHNAEICEMAALRVVEGEEENRIELLVHIDGEMPAEAEMVHHISGDLIEDAKHMTGCLDDFLRFVGDDAVLVGHNIEKFDIPLLKRVAGQCGREFRYERSIDTLSLAKRVWPGLTSYKMDSLRTSLGLDFDDAHRALKDCRDEAALYLRLREDAMSGKASGKGRASKTQSRRTPRSGTGSGRQYASHRKAREFVPSTSEFDSSHPLYLRNVVITGDLVYMSREDAMQRICDLGGTPQDNVTMKTNIVVVGEDPGKGKMGKAEDYRTRRGLPIEIVTAEEFRKMLES